MGVYAALAQFLIIGVIVFATGAYGGHKPWAMIVVHWITLALGVVTVLRWLRVGDVRLPRGWIHLPLAVLAVMAVASTARSIYPFASMRETLRILNYIALFYLVAMNLTTKGAILRVLGALVVLGAVLPFEEALQDWTQGRTVLFSGLAQSFQIGTFSNQNHFGAFLAMVIPLGLGLAVYLIQRRQWAAFGGVAVCVALMVVALMETLTRAAWMGVIVGLIVTTGVVVAARGLSGERKAWVAVVVAAGLLFGIGFAPAAAVEHVKTVLNLGETDASMAFLWAAWGDSLRLIGDHPILGTGPGTFYLSFARYGSSVPKAFVDFLHNDYLQYAAEMGLLAALALVVMILLVAGILARSLLSSSQDALTTPVLAGLLGAVTAFGVVLLYSFELYITANGLTFCTLAASSWTMSGIRVGGVANR